MTSQPPGVIRRLSLLDTSALGQALPPSLLPIHARRSVISAAQT